MAILTAERLRELLSYDPDTGVFTRKIRRSNALAGSVAGTKNGHGYLQICIDRQRYMAHRLAWLHVHGDWPSSEIDHKNRIRDDNRICNLRDTSSSENNHNRPLPRHNTSGFKGVCWDKRKRRWLSRIYVNGEQRRLGHYRTPEEAHLAYVAAAATLVAAVCSAGESQPA